MKNLLLSVMKSEIEKSTGCTDPGSVCLAVARAMRELGNDPERVVVTVSPNVYKNGVSVGVPGTGKRGLHLAAALGCFLDKSEEGLNILDFVTPELIERANQFLLEGHVTVTHGETPDPLYVKAEVFRGEDVAVAVISADYSNIIYVARNGVTLLDKSVEPKDESKEVFIEYKLEELYKTILDMDAADLKFLIDFARINKEAALTGLEDDITCLGKQLKNYEKDCGFEPITVASKARTMTAAAGEARMMGLIVPIMAIAGSGNHGITNFLGVLSVAEELNVDEETLARALAISSMITIYIKGYIKRMTAFCGCSVTAAAGVAAATVYMRGGSFQQGVQAMQSIIGTLGGMFCDGAKESCAYKISTATTTAVQFAYMAMDGCGLPYGVGIVGNTIEDTFYNLGQLNNPGMVETDRVIVRLIERSHEQKLK